MLGYALLCPVLARSRLLDPCSFGSSLPAAGLDAISCTLVLSCARELLHTTRLLEAFARAIASDAIAPSARPSHSPTRISPARWFPNGE